MKVELGRVLVVSAARLHVSLMLESPETSEDFEGFFALVTVVADSEGRGSDARAIAQVKLISPRNAWHPKS